MRIWAFVQLNRDDFMAMADAMTHYNLRPFIGRISTFIFVEIVLACRT
jgi:hypothetical protein